MKEFLMVINKMLAEMNSCGSICEDTVQQMVSAYKSLTAKEQQKTLNFFCEIFYDSYSIKIYFLSVLISFVPDKKILHCLQKILASKEHPLWSRLNDMSNLKTFLFLNPVLYELEEYSKLKNLYLNILEEIRSNIKGTFRYIPYEKRNKIIIIVVKSLLSVSHAPTRIANYIYKSYKNMGYHMECFVCCLKGDEGAWRLKYLYNNFIDKTTYFDYMNIEGYNLVLKSSDYIEELNRTIGLIWSKKPEFVFEIGDETILAGLCNEFTTVITMGCTKKLPVTNAPLIASFVAYSEKERYMQREMLDSTQQVIEIECDLYELKIDKQKVVYTKEMFGLKENDFVVIIAGRRLDYEIDDSFKAIMHEILEISKSIIIVIIGECPKIKKEMEHGDNEKQIFFLGEQKYFRETIAIGDVFLNPPRQGGGTGGVFALMENVPVITLDDCDVEVNAGSDFVCSNIEEMPILIARYFSDKEFMKQQKENCRKRADILLATDSNKSLYMLCDIVKEHSIQREKEGI